MTMLDEAHGHAARVLCEAVASISPVTEEQHAQLAVAFPAFRSARRAACRHVSHHVVRLAELVPCVVSPPPHGRVNSTGVILRNPATSFVPLLLSALWVAFELSMWTVPKAATTSWQPASAGHSARI